MMHIEQQNVASQPTICEEHFRSLYDLKKNYEMLSFDFNSEEEIL
jgi:hypothetical protein